MHSKTASEDALAIQARGGCRDCFANVYERTKGFPARYVYETLLRNFDAALEIEDEAWRKAFERLGTYTGDRPFKAWLLAITRNQALNHLRHLRAAPRPELIRPDEVLEATPLDLLEGREAREQCARLVGALPMELREPYFLRMVAGLTNGAAADVLRLPVSTVRGRLFRARRALAEAVRQTFPPCEDVAE